MFKKDKYNPVGSCEYCGKPIQYKANFCTACGRKNDGWVVPGKDQCGNCNSLIDEKDKYCSICGTIVGGGKFLPYQNIMQCIYGPMPKRRVHECKHCGYMWEDTLMVDRQKYCKQCGRVLKGIII